MKWLARGMWKLAGFLIGVGVIIGLLIYTGAFSKNDAIHVTANGGQMVGFGTSVAAGGFLSFLGGLGDGISVWKADQNGQDKVPANRQGTGQPVKPKPKPKPSTRP